MESTTKVLLPFDNFDDGPRFRKHQAQSTMIPNPPPSPEGNAISRQNNYTAHQKHIQQILAVSFASISILSALLTISWFFKLKRIFRHELIMLLVASNMFKAIWYFIPAIVILVQNRPIPIKLCQGAGFLLSVGIESAGLL